MSEPDDVVDPNGVKLDRAVAAWCEPESDCFGVVVGDETGGDSGDESGV